MNYKKRENISETRMKAILTTLILVIGLFHECSSLALIDNKLPHHISSTYDLMINGLESLLQFYKRNFKEITVDGYIGLLKAKEYLGATVENIDKGLSPLSTQQANQVKQIFENCSVLLIHIEAVLVNSSSSKQYDLFKMVHTPHPIPNQLISLRLSNVHSGALDKDSTAGVKFANISDMCLMDIIGTRKRHQPACTFSDICWKGITNYHARNFDIIHQLFAIFVGQKLNCTNKMNVLAQKLGGIENVKAALCSRIYRQMYTNLNNALNKMQSWELFLAQIYICGGPAGFQKFVDAQFLSAILHWQSNTGCLKSSHSIFSSLGSELLPQNTLVTSSDHPIGGIDKACYSRRSAAATSVLSMYLHWFSSKKEIFILPTPTNSTAANRMESNEFLTIIGLIAIGAALIAAFLSISVVYCICPLGRKGHEYQKLQSKEPSKNADE
ncbi:uncharacterized protein TRIADDRAFT_60908 [Trichoplax adhaerens]|uniref:Uncharacterized protein n=1 Tax=Trichoplax adhaerens TaxID=10228 RepID=B3S9H5_TRIAD|nr:hypothetical protein TRIADDRAFT_60908 [Trichoplax adhaerens]EDV20652.1 hypothetical protein TRIADDRAFT_60908 [Trichoplax adhaerens]|eukprot:XP_002116852.1 hypothetical protein TRIADDRAFT_60908 [Trichoplax adhaerens]